ncbi:RNA polymerase sigma factor [Xanthomarina spongicola]|uniref:RNA polymerase sigma-70 factor (ECF subfamily) n=1 Tax=Xanthomarina spongicola TaxID=570520 RepID=A0A316DQN3_9FLAO|nr:sigma-70 family RNA polymerase sigma factor [Xanthomarina spongicola]PWK19053.1 RNA polymerase sigma-70 factor (ECF subfamily) [Xanthomarina spongicola]
MKTDLSYLQLTDEELVSQIVKDENTLLFGILYDRYIHIIYNKCYGFSKSEHEAEDITQDVFVKLYTKLSMFRGESKFSTWLYAFTYNFCVNYINRNTAKKIEKNSVNSEQYDHLLIDTDDYNLFQLKVKKLQKALKLINPEDKMILLLKYQDDLTIKDLEVVLEIGESAVKMRLKRAKAKIVEIYNNL